MTEKTDFIEVKNLRRVFNVYKKEAGIYSAFLSLLRRQWHQNVAVDDISFNIPRGSFVGFLGPNGAGKTTTLKMLSGILHPTSGSCSVMGFTPHQRKREFKRNIALVMGQKSQLIWDLPPTDTFLLHRDLYQLEHRFWKATRDTLIELLDVGHILHTPVRQLSLGERMKCELITSLLHEPKVLFLDEPTIGLDVVSQKQLWTFLRSYQKTNKTTIMLTSHYMEDIVNLCSRVIVINTGRLVYDGGLKDLVELTQPEKDVSIRLSRQLTAEERAKFAKMVAPHALHPLDKFTFQMKMPRDTFAHVISEILNSFPVEDLQVQESDLALVMQRSFDLKQAEPL